MFHKGLIFLLLVTQVICTPWLHAPFMAPSRGPADFLKQLGPARSHVLEFFSQKQDHFDPANTEIWPQRYFISNATYVPGSPVFLHLAGEWEADPWEIEGTYLGELANKLGAFTIDLEHRYFGKSWPVPDRSTENLRFQSMDQAIEDAVLFATTLKQELGLNGPWVLIGASYPANLAAYARAKYPDIFDSALASSAPVLAKFDFFEYLEMVDFSMRKTDPECPGVIQASTDELEALIAAGNSARITEVFNLTQEIDLSNKWDVMALFWAVPVPFSGFVQYNKWGTLDGVCERLIAGKDRPLETVAEFLSEFLKGKPLNIVMEDIYELHRTNVSFSDNILRSSFYQSCNEYGYSLTAITLNQPFGQRVPVDFAMNFCTEIFGPQFNQEHAEMGVAATNQKYGGLTPNVTRVLYTHGTLDPWYLLGIKEDLNAETPAILMEGESHCRDIFAVASPEDSAAVVEGRLSIERILAEWLQIEL